MTQAMTGGEQPPTGQQNPELRPPGARPESVSVKKGHHGLIWGGLALVTLIGLAVVLFLPKLVSETSGGNQAGQLTGSTTAPAPPTRLAGQEAAEHRNNAEKALQNFLQTRARMELANAPAWGEPQWSRALAGATRGDHLFGQRQFAMAATAFNESLELLQLLDSERGSRLASALQSGYAALEANDSEIATRFFETALSIEADHMEALDGLDQAQVRPEILRLMDAAEYAISNSDLSSAQASYRTAVDLDDAYQPAAAALRDTEQQINDLAFKDAMSRALKAIETGQVQQAFTALREAGSLKPNEEVLHDAREQLAQKRQQLWLASQRQMAIKQQQHEDWSGAVASYREVLAKVPQAAFARQGLAFAQDRERLHGQIDHYLAEPSRVYSDQPLANAEQLIVSAGTPPTGEVKLLAKVQRLQTLITEARTPLAVTLQSDGLTNVQIYHVGQLGQFTRQRLELRPGTYTVVGSRPGYRDVRQTLTVKPGPDQPALDIRCEETV